MYTFLLIIHMLIAVSLIGIVLLQRSEGGALGIGGNLGGMMSARGSANLLTRTTIILATCFMITSIVLAFFSERHTPRSIVDDIVPEDQRIIDVPDVPIDEQQSTDVPVSPDSGAVPNVDVPVESGDASPDSTDVPIDE